MLKFILILILTIVFAQLTGCCCRKVNADEQIQDSLLVFDKPPYHCFTQIRGSKKRPAAYYTCQSTDYIKRYFKGEG